MDEKVFSLLEKMYIEMQEMKSSMATKEEMQEIGSTMATKEEMQQGFRKVNQDMARLEAKMDENHKALYDGYKQSIEGINAINERVDRLADKVDNQELKLQVVKSAK
ncbi:conserved hypothetical protein [Alkaliphilus metalliredigens QYMF]|uniref:Uncharacterized protein n=1 Tax=Alkaliphilus metalliredigens (strain QYMF) TaxID=293826 RepID=A6TJN6_ALKMQ|nr:hypothetical protein [Alkaliphilus metalliredigens]ABR46404.1 conserved hypothetical protein [Alkaliphilus metalliredigens QYMF]